jgi:hypothetical protein
MKGRGIKRAGEEIKRDEASRGVRGEMNFDFPFPNFDRIDQGCRVQSRSL